MRVQTLGPWRLEAPLGQGRRGEVWRTRRDGDPREYALKWIPAADPAARERVGREIEGLRRLDHPNIPHVRDAGATDDAVWLVMDLAEGRPLSALRAPPGLDAALVLGLGRQLAEALAHAHARGVHHRDVKPANAIVDDHGRVVLVDFGLALLDGASDLTLEGRRPGTPAYAPPEWSASGPIDPGAADVYAWGVLLYELATGRAAFDPPGDPVARERPLELPDGEPTVAGFVRAATAPRPGDRPTAASLAEALAPWPARPPPFAATATGSLGLGPVAAPAGPPSPRVGRYVVEREIGRGGMGVVYRAYDPLLDRRVAIKRLFTTQEAARARFAREARSVARLDHPGLIRVLDSGADDVGPYFAMELVDGPDLATALASGAFDRDRALEVAIALGEALAAAHAAGIVHRDVKPANVILDGGVRPRLGDFGVAAVTDETRLTRADGVVGTPAYMAPEQAAGRAVDARADVYGLGAVLFEMLTGGPPGRADTPPDVPGADPSLAAVVRRALEPDPADRYPSMDAFVDDLRRARDGRPIARPGLQAALARAWRRPRARVAAALLVACGVAVAVPGGSATMRAWDAAAKERTAEDRRVAMEAEIARLLASGDVAGADRAFDTFASFPDHEGTAALGLAWQAQARRLDDRPGSEDAAELAWAQAWATAEGDEAQAGALLGLGDALVRDGRYGALGHLVALGEGAGPELDGVRTTWARWRRAPTGVDGVDALAARLVAGTRVRWSATARPAAVDDDGDGLPELYVPTKDGVVRLPGGRWLDAEPQATTLGRRGDLFAAVVPGAGPVLVADGPDVADPKAVFALGPGPASRVVYRWTGGVPVSALGVDLGRDGAGELLLATGWPARTMLALTPAEGDWSARVLREESATNSNVDGLLPHAGGDALYATFGSFGGYDVRRLEPDGKGGLALRSRRKVGATGGLAAVRGPGGARWWAIGTSEGPPWAFPPGVPSLGNGLSVLDDQLAILGTAASPAHGCERPFAADLDGDGSDEVVALCGDAMAVADVGPGGALDPALLGGIEPLVVGDADGDGDDDVVAVIAPRPGDRRPWTETWVLGAGQDPIPRFDAAVVRDVPGGVDPALSRWWRRAEDLAGMELYEAAEARFEAIASLDPEGATGTSALLRAAEIAETRGDSAVAAARRSRAAERASAGPEVLLDAADAAASHHDFDEAMGFLERWRQRAGAEADRGNPTGGRSEVEADDGGRAARWAPGRDSPALDLDVGAPLDAAWRVERPLVLRRDAGAGELRVRSAGPGVAARLPVRVVGPLVELSMALDAERLEVGSGVALQLVREDGTVLFGGRVVVHGGGGVAEPAGRATVGAREAVAAGVYPDVPGEEPLPFEIDASWWAPEGRLAGRVSTSAGTQAGERALDDRVEGDLWLELSSGEIDGAVSDVAIRRISLRGLAIRKVGPATSLEAARKALADGDARAVLGADLPDVPEARVLRAVALDDLGRQDEADEALVAAARVTPDADLARLFGPLLLDGPTRLAGAARRGLGDRWAPLFAATFQALGYYHPEGERFVTAFTRTLGDVSGAGDPATEASLETLRARAWRESGRPDLAEDAARRAVALARDVPPADVPDHPTTPLADALYELALLQAPRDPDGAVALLREAIGAAEAPEIVADRVCADPAFATLRTTDGWEAVDAARRSAYPATR